MCFAKKLFDLEARKFVSLSGGEKHCSVCLLVKIQQEVTVATTTTTTTLHIYYYLPLQLQIYNLLLMALEIAFGVQLSRYNSKKKFCYRKHQILPLLLKQRKQLRHTTDDTKLGVTASLFSMSLLIYNKPFYYK